MKTSFVFITLPISLLILCSPFVASFRSAEKSKTARNQNRRLKKGKGKGGNAMNPSGSMMDVLPGNDMDALPGNEGNTGGGSDSTPAGMFDVNSGTVSCSVPDRFSAVVSIAALRGTVLCAGNTGCGEGEGCCLRNYCACSNTISVGDPSQHVCTDGSTPP